MHWKDAVGKLTDLGITQPHDRDDTYTVEEWQVDKTDYFGEGEVDSRVLGPMHTTFPHPEGSRVEDRRRRRTFGLTNNPDPYETVGNT